MTKTKKAPTYQYGIEITKPHSKDMYSHNDMVALEMKRNILSVIHKAYSNSQVDTTSASEDLIRKIGKSIEGSGYGHGYELEEIKDNIINSLANVANWQMHEEYSYLSFKNSIVPRTRFMMVGFEWEKHDYSFCTEADLSPVLDMVGFEGTAEALNKI